MEEFITYEKASAKSAEDTNIESVKNSRSLAGPKRKETNVCSFIDVPITYLKSQIKEEVNDGISCNINNENREPILNMKGDVNSHTDKKEIGNLRIKIKVETDLIVEEDWAGSNTDDEEDVPISYWKSQINLNEEVDDSHFITDSEDGECISNLRYTTNILKDTHTGNKQDNDLRRNITVETDLMAEEGEAESNTDDEENELLTELKPRSKRDNYDDVSYLITDSEKEECISNLRCTTNILKENDDTHTGNKQDNDLRRNITIETDLMAEEDEAESNTDDEENELLTELKPRSKRDNDDDDNSTNTDDDKNYEIESDNSNSSDFEQEPKRPKLHGKKKTLKNCRKLPEVDEKKKAFRKCSIHIYSKFIIRQCPLCKLECYSIYYWKQHLNLKHNLEKRKNLKFKYNNGGAKCKLCDFQMTTTNFNKLLDHEITHMPHSNYLKCKLCDLKMKTRKSIHFHLRQKHPEALLAATKSLELTVCPYCHHKFVSNHKLRSHMIQKHEKSIDNRTLFLCLECDQEFTSNVQLRAHVFEKFSKYTTKELCFEEKPPGCDRSAYLQCYQCPQTFRGIEKKKTQINIREHYMLHLGDSSGKLAYKCKYCAEGIGRYGNIRFHVCEKLLNLQKGADSKQARLPNRKTATKTRPSRKYTH